MTSSNKASFTVYATGTNITYQWSCSKDGGNTWELLTVPSATSRFLYVTPKASMNGYLYRCTATDQFGNSTTSDIAILTVT